MKGAGRPRQTLAAGSKVPATVRDHRRVKAAAEHRDPDNEDGRVQRGRGGEEAERGALLGEDAHLET